MEDNTWWAYNSAAIETKAREENVMENIFWRGYQVQLREHAIQIFNEEVETKSWRRSVNKAKWYGIGLINPISSSGSIPSLLSNFKMMP